MSEPLRIGSVPYLNGKPLIAWFDSADCDVDARLIYDVPSALAPMLRAGELDVAMVSSFEALRAPGLRIVPDVSISADGLVKSVRLFSRVPYGEIRTVAMDASSLTSVALSRIVLADAFGAKPRCVPHPPDLEAMLTACDAALLIGELRLFETPARFVLDLGEAGKALTGLPFVYAAWLAPEEPARPELDEALLRARLWGEARLEELSVEWAARMALPLPAVQDYFHNVMRYDLDAPKRTALAEFRRRSAAHGICD
jgi:chorismate dehydratase